MCRLLHYTGTMTTKSGTSSAIQRFLNLIRALNESAAFPCLDVHEQQLLNRLEMAWANGQRFIAPDAASTATVNAANSLRSQLESLRRKGVIQFLLDSDDRRISYVVATSMTAEHFAKLKHSVVITPGNSV